MLSTMSLPYNGTLSAPATMNIVGKVNTLSYSTQGDQILSSSKMACKWLFQDAAISCRNKRKECSNEWSRGKETWTCPGKAFSSPEKQRNSYVMLNWRYCWIEGIPWGFPWVAAFICAVANRLSFILSPLQVRMSGLWHAMNEGLYQPMFRYIFGKRKPFEI